MSIEDGPTVTDVWVTKELCFDHDGYADHEYKVWRGPGHHVTTECLGCGAVREIQDNGR